MEFQNYKELIMYYQTTIRNVFLSTAVSFAALGYSRFYRDKSKIYSVGLVFISFLILLCSFVLNYYLYESLKDYKNNEKFSNIQNWEIINKVYFIVHFCLLLFALYTIYRLKFNKMFVSFKK